MAYEVVIPVFGELLDENVPLRLGDLGPDVLVHLVGGTALCSSELDGFADPVSSVVGALLQDDASNLPCHMDHGYADYECDSGQT